MSKLPGRIDLFFFFSWRGALSRGNWTPCRWVSTCSPDWLRATKSPQGPAFAYRNYFCDCDVWNIIIIKYLIIYWEVVVNDFTHIFFISHTYESKKKPYILFDLYIRTYGHEPRLFTKLKKKKVWHNIQCFRSDGQNRKKKRKLTPERRVARRYIQWAWRYRRRPAGQFNDTVSYHNSHWQYVIHVLAVWDIRRWKYELCSTDWLAIHINHFSFHNSHSHTRSNF